MPDAAHLELVNLAWEVPEPDVRTLGEIFQFERDWLPKVMRFAPCAARSALAAWARLRVSQNKHLGRRRSGQELAVIDTKNWSVRGI